MDQRQPNLNSTLPMTLVYTVSKSMELLAEADQYTCEILLKSGNPIIHNL